jgi:hypothetical protein
MMIFYSLEHGIGLMHPQANVDNLTHVSPTTQAECCQIARYFLCREDKEKSRISPLILEISYHCSYRAI